MAGKLMVNGSASSVTVASPSASRARVGPPRRVGQGPEDPAEPSSAHLTTLLINHRYVKM